MADTQESRNHCSKGGGGGNESFFPRVKVVQGWSRGRESRCLGTGGVKVDYSMVGGIKPILIESSRVRSRGAVEKGNIAMLKEISLRERDNSPSNGSFSLKLIRV